MTSDPYADAVRFVDSAAKGIRSRVVALTFFGGLLSGALCAGIAAFAEMMLMDRVDSGVIGLAAAGPLGGAMYFAPSFARRAVASRAPAWKMMLRKRFALTAGDADDVVAMFT